METPAKLFFKKIYPFILSATLIFVCLFSSAQVNVLTQHYDNNRTGWYNREQKLTTRNVKPGSFGKLFTLTVDDQLYAQPLVMNVNLPGIGSRNVVYLATVNNSIYAYDADSASITAPYWQKNLTPAGARAVKNTDMTGACGGNYKDFSGNMGIVGTPVVDSSSNTLYVVVRSLTVATNIYQQFLHALDITSGAEKANSPKLITAQINGGGDGNVGGIINFDAQKQNQRPGLLLLNDKIFIAWSSHCDWGPYHGWVMGYDKNTLEQKIVYNATPEGYNGGIWMSGAGPSADENGNIYLAVGNGSVGVTNNPSNTINRSESALKLTPNGSGGLTVSSYFTPINIAELEAADLDFGVTEVLLIPGTNRALTSCKDGRIYLLDRDNMGGYNAGSNNVLQTIDLGINAHLRSSFGYYKGEQKEWVYSWSENALLKAFPYSRTSNLFDLPNTVNSATQGPTGNNGAFLSVSSNGSIDSTAVLWASHAATGDANQSVRPGILRAFDANDVTRELWNSSQYSTDNPGNYAKFNCPVVANGKVYLSTFSNKLVVYGLTGTSGPDTCNSTNVALNKIATASSEESAAFPAGAAFDGNTGTRWSSLAGDPQSIYVDLGARYDFCKVVLRWDIVKARDFKIQVSEDAQIWSTLVSITSNSDSENYFPVRASGRYVRMYGTARAGTAGYSLREFEVYGKLNFSNCPEPNSLSVTDIYESSSTLRWNGSGAKQFQVAYKTASASSWSHAMADTNFLNVQGLACSSDYLWQVRSICGGTDSGSYSSPSAFSTLPCNSNCGPLPTRWTTQDIGDVGVSGSACFKDGVFELHASGTDIWDTQDGFRFAYKTLVGDGEIKARVLMLDQLNPWNKCGIMFRESLSPGSRHVFIALTSGNGVALQNRLVTDDYSNNINTGNGITAPYWIKLAKKGNVYTAYYSTNGNNWAQIGNPVDAGFGADLPLYAGLAFTGHDNGNLSRATLDNYLFSGIVELQLQSFTASLNLDKTVALQWVTTLEKNIRDFVLERSGDNKHYVDIDTIAAVNNGAFTQTYNDQDKTPLQGFNYYRLRITTLDGAVSYSAPAFVRIANTSAPVLFPNPASGTVYVAQGTDPVKSVAVYDMSGRLMKRIDNTGNSIIDIRVNSFSNGIYIVEIKTENSVYRQKLLVGN